MIKGMRLHTLFYSLVCLFVSKYATSCKEEDEQMKLSLIAMLGLLLLSPGCAAKYPLKPSSEAKLQLHDLFENHIVAIGGRTAFLKKKNMRIEGRVRTMESNMVLSFETIKIAPNQLWTQLTDVKGETRSRGWDGQQGWLGDRMLSSEQSRELARNADFYFPLNHHEIYIDVFRIDQTVFGGRPCFVVLSKTQQGEWYELFFDQNNDLLIGYSRWQEGKEKYWYRFGHYTDVEGIKHPLSIEEKSSQYHKLILIESISWNLSDLHIPFPQVSNP